MYKNKKKTHHNNGDKMKETNELLMHIYQTSDMGAKSTTKLIELLKNKDNKIKKILEDELKEYEEIKKKSEKILKKEKINPKDLGIMAEMMSSMSMKMEVMKDNSDSAIASMLIEGFTMGTIEMNKKLEAYKDTDKNIINLGKDLLKFQEKEIEKLKEFL